MPRHLLLLLVLFLSRFACHAQPSVDSLKSELGQARDPRTKADLYNNLAVDLFHYTAEEAYQYATKGYEQSRAIDYVDGMRYALILKSAYHIGVGRYKEALADNRESAALETGDDDLKAYNLVMMGNAFQSTADYDSAGLCYKKAIALQASIKSDKYLPYAYKNLGRLYVLQWKNRDALEVLHRALELYQKKKSHSGIADTWFAISDVYVNQGDYGQARRYVEHGCLAAEQLDDDFLRVYCQVNEGEIHFNEGQYAEALKHLFTSLDKMDSLNHPELQARIYQDLGDVYDALGETEVSLKYFLESLKIAERIGIKHLLGQVKSNIAWIYKNQHNFRMAHANLKESMALRMDIGDEHGISNSYNVLGVIYFEEGKYDSAMVALDQSLIIRQRLGYEYGISACLFNKALVLEEQRQYPEALRLQFEALEIEDRIGNDFTLGISYNSIGSLYYKLGDFKKAQHYLSLAANMAKNTGSKTLRMNNNLYWSEFYEAKGDLKRALEYFKSYASVNDSIYSDVSATRLAELQALYQVEKKDQEIKLLNQQQKLQEAEIQLQRSRINLQTIIIASIVLGLLLVSMLAFKTSQYSKTISKANREITEQKEEIQAQREELIEANTTIADINRQLEGKIEHRTKALTQAYKELDTFFYRSSHDFRRPLTTFLGLAEVAKVTVKDTNALELFDKVKETAVNLDKMLVKLQSISDVGSQQMVFKEVLLKEIFDNVCDQFRDELHRRNIRTVSEIRLVKRFISYPAMVKTIIENLVENAIQFCGVEGCYIRLHAYQSGDDVVIEVQDNGQGIALEYHDQIFDMYFRGSERSKGNGLGLYIIKKAVEKLDGTINVTSVAGTGSTFSIRLPNR